MATSVPDNHDKAHEVMTEEQALERGKALAEQNNAREQARREEQEAQLDKGFTPVEGDVPENNEDNGQKVGGVNPGDVQDSRAKSSKK